MKQKTSQYRSISACIVFLLLLLSSFFMPQRASAATWTYQGIAFYAYKEKTEGAVAVYRFYNKDKGDHLYTADESEMSKLKNNKSKYGFTYEGIVFYAYPNQADGTVPVYRFYSSSRTDHLYTASEEEKQNLTADTKAVYKYENVAFYAYAEQLTDTLPVYHFYDSSKKDTYYTISEQEKNIIEMGPLGPEISVGLWQYSKSDLQKDYFRISANKDYNIKDKNGAVIATVKAASITRVKYKGDKNFTVSSSIPDKDLNKEVFFDAADGKNADIIFDVNKPNSDFDDYRGTIRLKYVDYSDKTDVVWVIEYLPLEQYVWGIGEIHGTGDSDYNKTMTTAFRTYGYWKLKYSTKYAQEGFKVDTTPGNQIYNGYQWEKDYPNVKKAAQDNQGKILKYKSDIALAPYSSWTDGKTRSFKERWGSDDYPWCQSVKDPWGKHPTMTTSQLVAAGNHMVGISAHGALSAAGDHDWGWEKILKYYLTGISISKIY